MELDKIRARAVMTAAAAAAVAATGFCNSAHATVVIQEVYGDAGFAATTTYSNNYVTLYNAGTSAVTINGYLIETGSATGVPSTSFPTIVYDTAPLAPGGYFLIEGRTAGTFPGVATFPTPNEMATADITTTPTQNYFSPSFSQGKIALYDASGTLQDFVGYGGDAAATNTTTTMTFPAYEGTGPAGGAASGVFTGTNALTRTFFADAVLTGPDTTTESNGTDFVSDAPNPRSTPVPEPTSLGVIAAGGGLLVARRRRR